MTNAEVRENLKAYVDGELCAEEAELVRAALELEPSLRDEVAALQLLSESLAALRPEVEAGSTDVAELARQVSQKRDRWRAAMWLLAPAFAVLLLFVFVRDGQQTDARDHAVANQLHEAKTPSRQPGFVDNGPVHAKGQASFGLMPRNADPSAGERMVIRTASVVMQVDSARDAERIINELVRKRGGLVAASSSSSPTGSSHTVTVTLRVPASHLHSVVEAISAVGRVTARNVNATDVTDSVADNEARLRSLRAQEKTYLRLLDRTKTVQDVLQVEAQLGNVRTRIEQLETRLANTKRQVAMSTLTVSLHQNTERAPEPRPSWLSQSWNEARAALVGTGRWLATVLIFIGVYVPVWGSCLLIVWLVRRHRGHRW